MFNHHINPTLLHSLLVICTLLSGSIWAQDLFSQLPDPTRPDLGFAEPTTESNGNLTDELIGIPSDDLKIEAPAELLLQYTLISSKRRFAVINGKTIAEGETIEDAKIIEVRPEQVVARRQGKQIILDLARYQTQKEKAELSTEEVAGGNNEAPK